LQREKQLYSKGVVPVDPAGARRLARQVRRLKAAA
jgi:hypothetical protein